MQEERTRDRRTTRTVQVFSVPEAKPYTLWAGLRSVVRVERSGTRGEKPYHETVFYISSHTASAEAFARIVRGHWQVEMVCTGSRTWCRATTRVRQRRAMPPRTSVCYGALP